MTGWFAAAYVWRKELPPLAGEVETLQRPRRRARQTTDEAALVLQSIGARLGIPIKTTPPKEKR